MQGSTTLQTRALTHLPLLHRRLHLLPQRRLARRRHAECWPTATAATQGAGTCLHPWTCFPIGELWPQLQQL